MGSEARTRLALAGLLTATLFAFEQVYAQGDYFGPSLLAMMAAAGLAIGARRLGISTGITLLVGTGVLTIYLSLVFAAPQTFYGLPGPKAVEKLWLAVTRAYAHAEHDYAPVPLRPGYTILTVIGMWFATTIGEIATFRWRRPLLASLGPIFLFSFVLVLGTQAMAPALVALFLAALFTYLGLESSHRVRSWGRWVPTWTEREGKSVSEPHSVTGGLARRMGAACVAAALVTPFFLPAIEDGFLKFRDGGEGEGPGFGTAGSGGVVDPLVSIVPQLITQTDKELFTVRTSEGRYWRLVTLTKFDGEKWTPGPAGVGVVDEFGRVPLDIPPPAPGTELEIEVEITGLRGSALPLAGLPILIEKEADGANLPLTVNQATGDVETSQLIHDGFRYTVRNAVPNPSFGDLQRAEIGAIPSEALMTTAGVTPATFDLATKWTEDYKTPFQKLVAIQDRLRNTFVYDLDVEPSSTANYLEDFLLVTRRGYCQQFATAFALLARTLGYPSRVVVGFLPGSADEIGEYVIRGTDTHAWPEVFFEGLGWIPFEPTPRGSVSTPSYTNNPRAGAVEVRFGGGQATTDSGGSPGRDVAALEEGSVGRAAGSNRRGSRSIEEGGGGGGVINREWRETFGRLAFALVIAGLAFLLFVPAFKQWRIRRRYRRATDPGARAAAAFSEFEVEAAELAAPRSKAESAAAYAERVAHLTGLPKDLAMRLADIYEAAEYAPAPIAGPLGAEAQQIARRLRSRLWAHASWWARIQRLFSPAGLLSRT